MAFVLGIAVAATLALAAQRNNLRDELQRERETPAMVVIRD